MTSFPLASLNDLGEIVTGSTPLTSDQSNYGESFPFITPGELDQADPIVSSRRNLSEAGIRSVRALPVNSVLVCCIGSLGKVGITGTIAASNQQINAIISESTDCVSPIFTPRLSAPAAHSGNDRAVHHR